MELNSKTTPKVQVNSKYAALISKEKTSSDISQMKSQLQEARWFIKSLQQRNDTLLKVAKKIVERQTGFLEHGPSAMKPLVLHDISKEVDWLLSVFHDNSGVIAWNKDWSLCIKAETHNSPSALDPFGGAMTGIVGVNRDILGTGLGAGPIANTDVFCFGPPDYTGNIPKGLFHPSRVFRGVHAGVRAGGNESGIPTVNGAITVSYTHLTLPTKA